MTFMSKGIVTRYWLAGAIAATVVAAIVYPSPAVALPDTCIIDVGVIVVMFLGSLKLAPSRFREAMGRVDLLLMSLASVFVVAPTVSLGGAWLLGMNSSQEQLAVLICTAQASTLATAIVLTEVAGGDVALAMVVTVVNNSATVVLTPLVFRLAAGADVRVDHMAMAGEMALKLVVPVLAAQVARIWLAKWAARHKRKLSVASQLIILVYIYAGVGAAGTRLEGAAGALLSVSVLVVALHAVMLIVNGVVARVAIRSPESRTAFIICSSQKTLPAAILVWKSYFPALPLGPLVAVAYHMLQLVVDSLMAPDFLRLPLVRNRSRSTQGNGHEQS